MGDSTTRATRRAAVAAAIAAAAPTKLRETTVLQLAASYGCSRATIWHDVRTHRDARRSPTAVIAEPLRDTRTLGTEVLRLLGRMEYASTRQIAALILGSHHARQTRVLRDLREAGYVWHMPIGIADLYPTDAQDPQRRGLREPNIYGLTRAGLDYLRTCDAEATPTIYDLLRCRAPRAPLPLADRVRHDLLVSRWCASFLDAVRRCVWVEAISCHVEFVAARDAAGKELQRFDALLTMRVSTSRTQYVTPAWRIPWATNDPGSEDGITLRFALEVDRGTEPLTTIIGKAVMYRDLTMNRHYEKTLGGPVMPVFLTPPGQRAAQIARAWQHAWKQGAGYITTFKRAYAAERADIGILGGTYFPMRSAPTSWAQHGQWLLADALPDVTIWQQACQGWGQAEGTTHVH